MPVHAAAGRFGGGPGYVAALRRGGSARAAAAAVAAFFRQRGWRIARRTALSTGGYVLTIAGPSGQDSASVVIDRHAGRQPVARIVAAVLT
ncbi:hypothetical protein [Candidatus Solirubrobacter pratensis]|uniref:hypothetical protein n=1 Tax=Candidatus Solirubrobacter pratensis TaxID=1298857 RepID=UPI0012DFC9E1|nr:hypothetical protein [Candidatus Solirubrobacter pratensis]